MLISEILEKQNNNFKLLRLLAAWAVIWGHAYALVPNSHSTDPVQALLGFTYSGALAVKIFFFLSGLLVTNSLIRGASTGTFIVHRIFRIWPGLILTTFSLAFIIGPLITTLNPEAYFGNSEVYKFLLQQNVFLPGQTQQGTLPGVFSALPWQLVDGSLWTISFEVGCYAALIACWTLGVYRQKYLLLIAVICSTWLAFLPENLIYPTGEIRWALVSFIWGTAIARFQKSIRIGVGTALALSTLAVLARPTSLIEPVTYLAVYAWCIWLFSTKIARSIQLPGDYSYGIYLWGWPTQQLLLLAVGVESLIFNQLTTIVIATGIGALSWHFIEKPAVSLSKKLFGKNTSQFNV